MSGVVVVTGLSEVCGEAVDEVLRRLRYPGRGGMRGGVQDPDPPVGVLDHREHVQPRPDKVTVSKKSDARSASAWERRKSAQVLMPYQATLAPS